MNEKLILQETVSYRDVDRAEVLLLPVFVQYLQEAAIAHANQYDTGTKAMTAHGESWVLNRMGLEIARYPKFEESLRIETWSRGIKGFKGYREFRVFDAQNALVLSGSSLWVYINIGTKAIVRVPTEVAAGFPVCSEGPFVPEIDRMEFTAPAADAVGAAVALRYSDVDVQGHVNNTVYFDLVQTALARAGANPRPRCIRIKYAKAISAVATSVTVRVGPSGERTAFSIEEGATVFAAGDTQD
jgi:acyl-ACP thioesterase